MYRLPACLLCILALCGFGPPSPAAEGTVALSLIDCETDRELDRHPHHGQSWVVGTPGHRYSVRLRNLGGERVLVVLSVDGINAISGQTAATDQAGYVLEPWQSSEITGWRKSQSEVAQFVFSDRRDSYADRTGRPANVGVVGIAVFGQAPPLQVAPPLPRRPLPRMRHDAQAATAESTAAADTAAAHRQQLGTGHGEREDSFAADTRFERASRTPLQVSELRYDTRARLVALGVLPPHPQDTPPRAFPQDFVPDPPARQR